MKNEKRVGLGTRFGFVERNDRGLQFWTIDGGLPRGVLAYRITPTPEGVNLDRLPMFGPWEDATSGLRFPTPEAAAAHLVQMIGTGTRN